MLCPGLEGGYLPLYGSTGVEQNLSVLFPREDDRDVAAEETAVILELLLLAAAATGVGNITFMRILKPNEVVMEQDWPYIVEAEHIKSCRLEGEGLA